MCTKFVRLFFLILVEVIMLSVYRTWNPGALLVSCIQLIELIVAHSYNFHYIAKSRTASLIAIETNLLVDCFYCLLYTLVISVYCRELCICFTHFHLFMRLFLKQVTPLF